MYAVYFSKSWRGKGTLIGTRENLNEAVEFGANAPGPGFFLVQNMLTGEYVDVNNL